MKKVWHYDYPIGKLGIVENNGFVVNILFADKEHVDGLEVARTPVIDEAAQQIDAYFLRKRTKFDLPIHLIGTDFQRSCWKLVGAIPYGETRTYKAIAKDLGKPKAVRAVGSANGRNPLPIIIPCHRVIGSDGSLTGYGGGLSVKQFLLDLEKGKTPALP